SSGASSTRNTSAGGGAGFVAGGSSNGSGQYTGTSAGSTSRGSGGSSGASVQAAAGTTAVETYPRPCADIYDPNTLPTFNVEIAQSDWDAIVAGCEAKDQTYYPITFHYGAETLPAMIRLKGNWSWNCDKMQFQISFNESDKQGRFHGLRKLVLDAPSYDETLLRERLGFSLMRDLGTPFSCANNARLEINGKYYGLFVNLERVDAGYLKRQFAESDGNLYKEGRELTTNEETGDTASVDAFWAATTVSELDALVDLEEAVLVWAGLAMAPDADSYWAGVEINVYLYQHPTRGLLFIPYDMDTAFQRCATCDPITYEHTQWKRELQYQVVMSDVRWCTAFEAALRRARAAYDVAELKRRVETWSGQIAAALAADPNRTFTEQEAAESLASLRTLIEKRAAFVDTWLAQGSHCPPVWPTAP
ncbi:MAG: CotH kinase family protein, partial [Myxococcales bacterium]